MKDVLEVSSCLLLYCTPRAYFFWSPWLNGLKFSLDFDDASACWWWWFCEPLFVFDEGFALFGVSGSDAFDSVTVAPLAAEGSFVVIKRFNAWTNDIDGSRLWQQPDRNVPLLCFFFFCSFLLFSFLFSSSSSCEWDYWWITDRRNDVHTTSHRIDGDSDRRSRLGKNFIRDWKSEKTKISWRGGRFVVALISDTDVRRLMVAVGQFDTWVASDALAEWILGRLDCGSTTIRYLLKPSVRPVECVWLVLDIDYGRPADIAVVPARARRILTATKSQYSARPIVVSLWQEHTP